MRESFSRRPTTVVNDPLYARAIYFEDGDERAALVTLDLIACARELLDEALTSLATARTRASAHVELGIMVEVPAAALLAGPGDVVAVLPGTYREQVVIDRSGRADAYITFRAEGEGVFLTGSDTDFEQKGQDRWQALGDGLYVTSFPAQTGFVAAEGRRLYHYSNRVELEK